MGISRYSKPIEQTLEKYVPLPMDALFQAAEAIQKRGDLAQEQVDQAQVGIASISANPYHQDFINNYSKQFTEKSSALLDKFGSNTSNPEYKRESSKLIKQFALDPRLKAVQQSKLAYDKKQADKAELDAKGIKYVDTGIGYNGLDSNGQISSNVGTLRTTDYDKVIADRIKTAASNMEVVGDSLTNERNIIGTRQSLKQQLFTDPSLMLGIEHLMQQGSMNKEQATKTMNDYIDNVSTSMISSRPELSVATFNQRERHHNDDLNLKRAQLKAQAEANKTSSASSLGTYFVPSNGQRDNINNHEMPIAGKSNVSFNKPFKGVLTGERFVFSGSKLNSSVEKKNGSINIKDGTFVNVSTPYVITNIEGSNSKNYSSKKGQILSKDSGRMIDAPSGATSENIDIQTDSKGKQFVYLDEDRKIKGYVQPQAFGVYKDNNSEATIFKKLNRDETLMYLGPDAGKLSNDGYEIGSSDRLDADTKQFLIKSIQKRGLEPTQELLDSYADRIHDTKYYNERIAPLFSKPGTTTSPQEYYIGND